MTTYVVNIIFIKTDYSYHEMICFFFLLYGFVSATTLTSWHLMVTYCTLHVAYKLNFFENKPIDTKTVVLFGLLNGISIGLLNLSLGFNSIGFYQVYLCSNKLYNPHHVTFIWLTIFYLFVLQFRQMTKLAIIPFTVLLETLFLNKKFR